MQWMVEAGVAALMVAAYSMAKRGGQVSLQQAARYLKAGAPLIDVRSPEEFKSGHLAEAMNFPLDEIETALPRKLKDKDQVLLLHCQSGMRSGLARRKLAGAGYAQVFNLGSYARAAQVVKACGTRLAAETI